MYAGKPSDAAFGGMANPTARSGLAILMTRMVHAKSAATGYKSSTDVYVQSVAQFRGVS